MSGQASQEKLFGRFHELVLLLIGLIFTSVVGGYFGYRFQESSWKHRQEAELRESERVEATKIFEKMSSLMDTRLYRMRRIIWGYKGVQDNTEMEARWDSYRETLFDYNENLNRNLALLQRYFGDDIRERFETQIHGGFFHLNKRLEKLRDAGKVIPEELQQCHALADKINIATYTIDVVMIEMVQQGKYWTFQS